MVQPSILTVVVAMVNRAGGSTSLCCKWSFQITDYNSGPADTTGVGVPGPGQYQWFDGGGQDTDLLELM